MTHQMYDIWKDQWNPLMPWRVKTPMGIIPAKTKRRAVEIANKFIMAECRRVA